MEHNLRDIILYICKKYPHKNELSNARLTKLVYLSDWKNVLNNGRQLSGIDWIFNHYGPFVDDVLQEAQFNDDLFTVSYEKTIYGNLKQVINIRKNIETEIDEDDLLDANARGIINAVIEKTSPKSWNQFIQMVYSTYPVLTSEKGTHLNLIELRKKYKDTQENLKNLKQA
ncbi:MAG: Panacea domain-containing protein [Candidatus Gastranaerophilales bacterium]|nr:Panacea domain-containing protein [Candidatus Gastranaerophilales bacterium]